MASDKTTLRLFGPKRVGLWFAQVGTQSNINELFVRCSDTRWRYSNESAGHFNRTLVTHKFSIFKSRLVDSFRRVECEAAVNILEEGLSDSKPSELTEKIISLHQWVTFPFVQGNIPPQAANLGPDPHNSDRNEEPAVISEGSRQAFFIQWCYGQHYKVDTRDRERLNKMASVFTTQSSGKRLQSTNIHVVSELLHHWPGKL